MVLLDCNLCTKVNTNIYSQINLGSDRVQLTTFGQPRVGNAAFASCFAKYVSNTIRITHGHDIVPHLPHYFSFLPQLTYHHFPREVYLGQTLQNKYFSFFILLYCPWPYVYARLVKLKYMLINMLLEFQVWVQDSEGNTTEQICDDSGEDSDCCRFNSSYLPNCRNIVLVLNRDLTLASSSVPLDVSPCSAWAFRTISHTWELIWKRMIGAPVESSRRKVLGSFKRSSPALSS
jgi:hypothetical protein